MKKQKKVLKFVRNRRGMRIKECCASCVFKVFDIRYQRRCGLTGRRVAPGHNCNQWQMSKEMFNL